MSDLRKIAQEIFTDLKPKKVPKRAYGIPGTQLQGETETVYTITLTQRGYDRLKEALNESHT